MIQDMLGTLIGFATVMLLLSLAVTGLVQFLQSLLRVRSRNLKRVVEQVITDYRGQTTVTDDTKEWTKTALQKPGTCDRKLFRWTSPTISHVEPLELAEKLGKYLELDTDKLKQTFATNFDKMAGFLSKRKTLHIRVISWLCAAAVAVSFQVNSLELLRDLSTNPELRAAYVAQAEEVMATAERQLAERTDWSEVGARALDTLMQRHDDLRETLEEASGAGGSEEAILDELDRILKTEAPDRKDALVAEYEDLLDDFYAEARTIAMKHTREATGQLATFNITFWPEGKVFFRSFDNWLGLLITIIFLSFGAPFWYGTLSKLLNLRDVMKRKEEEKKPNGTT